MCNLIPFKLIFGVVDPNRMLAMIGSDDVICQSMRCKINMTVPATRGHCHQKEYEDEDEITAAFDRQSMFFAKFKHFLFAAIAFNHDYRSIELEMINLEDRNRILSIEALPD